MDKDIENMGNLEKVDSNQNDIQGTGQQKIMID